MLSLDHTRHLVEKPQSAEAGTAGTFCAFCASDIGKRGGSPCTLWACLGAGQLDNIFRFAWPEYARNFRPAAQRCTLLISSPGIPIHQEKPVLPSTKSAVILGELSEIYLKFA